MHLSVLVRPRLWADLLTDVVGRLLRSDPAFAGYPHPAAGSAEALDREFGARCELLAEALAKLDTGAELARLLPPGPAPGVGSRRGRPLQELLDADRLTSDTEVHRRPAARVEILAESGDKCRVSIDGNVYAMPGAVAESLLSKIEEISKIFWETKQA